MGWLSFLNRKVQKIYSGEWMRSSMRQYNKVEMIFLVPELGIEPRWSCPRRILSPLRLPVSPLRRRILTYVNQQLLSIKLLFSRTEKIFFAETEPSLKIVGKGVVTSIMVEPVPPLRGPASSMISILSAS